MKCIILAGGYAKRLWPITRHIPKPLLDVGNKPMIDHIIEKLKPVDEIDKIYISTNKKFEEPFRNWMSDHQNGKLELVIEPTEDEGGKFGTIVGIQYLIESRNIDDDCLIIAGDNLFDFDINHFIQEFRSKSPLLAVFDVKDYEKSMLYGIVSVDENSKVIGFVEKPENPQSTLAATVCYGFPKETMKLFSEYLSQGNRKDSPGFFVSWLQERVPVYAYRFEGHWFDIGDFESLEKARKFMNNSGK